MTAKKKSNFADPGIAMLTGTPAQAAESVPEAQEHAAEVAAAAEQRIPIEEARKQLGNPKGLKPNPLFIEPRSQRISLQVAPSTYKKLKDKINPSLVPETTKNGMPMPF